MALDIGAMPYGHWSGCHAVGWDLNAPPFGDVNVGDQFQKHSYPWGIMINANGERFVDEGADFRNYTYAKYGRVVLEQPGMFAWQVFDQKIIPMLRDEYRIKQVTKVSAEHARGAGEEDGRRERRELPARDHASTTRRCRTTSRSTWRSRTAAARTGLKINKTNWANTIEEPPFEAYARHLRRHLQLRRPEDHQRRRSRRTPAASRSPASSPRASWSAASSITTIRAARGSPPARCSARSPAPARGLRQED